MKEELLGQLYTFLALVGLGAFVALCAVVGAYFNRRSKDSRVWGAVNACWLLMQTAVAHAEKELRPEIQKALKDGKLTKEESAELKSRVVRIFKDQAQVQLGEVVKLLGLNESAVGVFISGLLEKAVGMVGISVDASKVPAPSGPPVLAPAANVAPSIAPVADLPKS